MAHYTRFEIYIPVVYVSKKDNKTHALDDGALKSFIGEITGRYQGITQAHPLAPALYKGWWRKDTESPFVIDHLTYLFGLVRLDQSDEARKVFEDWKTRLEEILEQDIILMIYYSVQTIGGFI